MEEDILGKRRVNFKVISGVLLALLVGSTWVAVQEFFDIKGLRTNMDWFESENTALVGRQGELLSENQTLEKSLTTEIQRRKAADPVESIDYADFFAKAHTAGLIEGKRYRFTADIAQDLHVVDRTSSTQGFSNEMQGYPAFDNTTNFQNFLRNRGEGGHGVHEIIASLRNGQLQIHQVD